MVLSSLLLLDTFIAEVNEGEEGGQKESDTGYQTGEKEEGEGKEEEKDLDTTLESLGLSHESIGKVIHQAYHVIQGNACCVLMPDTFIDDVDEETNDSSKLCSQGMEEREEENKGEGRGAGRGEGAHFSLDEFGLDEDCAR